ncbi:MAG TPA: peptidyl-prolyl cis-trans isomerase [Verrucomicrobiae bacterium]|nr:peptidyl-prolyl cis-trans isomerase [Verrucomicrobiae bacterium]
MIHACVLLSVLLAVLCCSCSKKADPKQATGSPTQEEILAWVGDQPITAREFQAEQNRRWHNAPITEAQQQRLLEDLIREKATLAKARAAGLDRSPETVALVERLIVARYTEAEFAKRFGKEPEVEDAEIQKFYGSNLARFQIPAAVRAGLIWLPLSPKADVTRRAALLANAEALRERAASADAIGFRALVQQHSEDQATRYTGGDTGWLHEGQPASCHPAVMTAALQLQQAGEVAPLVVVSNGVYIVRLLERRMASTRPLIDVREAICYELQQQKRAQREQEFFAEMKRGLDIKVNRDVLNSISTPTQVSNAAPPALPGS